MTRLQEITALARNDEKNLEANGWTTYRSQVGAAAAPAVPTSPVATRIDNDTVRVTFVEPNPPGDTYIVTSSPGGFTAEGSQAPVTLNATFVTATPYTFTVKAKGPGGTSAASAASPAVTPKPTVEEGEENTT